MNIKQPVALHQGKLVSVDRLSPGEITSLRDETLLCPVCEKEGSVAVEDSGPLFAHSANHEPETRERMQSKKLLQEHLKYIFSQAQLELNVNIGGQNADIAILHPKGARIALRYFSSRQGIETIPLWRDVLLRERVHFISILDADILPRTIRRKEGTEARKLVVSKLESTLLAMGEDLLYLNGKERLLHSPSISPRVVALAEATQGKHLGSVPVVFYRHKLSALRVVQGRWVLDRTYNDPSPIAGYEEKFSSALEGMMEKKGL